MAKMWKLTSLKKVAILLGFSILVLTGSLLYYSKAYYPSLPFDSATKRDVLHVLKLAEGKLAKVTEEDGYEWYAARQGEADEQLQDMMTDRGWQLVEQMGSAFLFKRGEATLIIESEMWTRYYVLFQIPSSVRSSQV